MVTGLTKSTKLHICYMFGYDFWYTLTSHFTYYFTEVHDVLSNSHLHFNSQVLSSLPSSSSSFAHQITVTILCTVKRQTVSCDTTHTVVRTAADACQISNHTIVRYFLISSYILFTYLLLFILSIYQNWLITTQTFLFKLFLKCKQAGTVIRSLVARSVLLFTMTC